MSRGVEGAGNCELAVVVFACDEAENVGAVLRELVHWLEMHEPAGEIIFVDDGSTDDTYALAEAALRGRRARLLRHGQRRGIGAALKSGVLATRARWVTFLPADGQIEPAAIATLRAASHEVAVVFSRYEQRDDGLDRKLLSLGVRLLISLVHQVVLQSDGPYLFRRELFDPSQLTPDSFFLNFEFPIRVVSAGLPFRTVSIRCRPRLAGRSKSATTRQVATVLRDLIALRARRFRGEPADRR